MKELQEELSGVMIITNLDSLIIKTGNTKKQSMIFRRLLLLMIHYHKMLIIFSVIAMLKQGKRNLPEMPFYLPINLILINR